MTNDQPLFEPLDEYTLPSHFAPEPPDMIEELPCTELEYPVHLQIEFDPLELGDAQDFRDSDQRFESTFNSFEDADAVVSPMEFLETPDGYTAPEFESFDLVDDFNQDLDALFSELSETTSGQSADIAVWCPWLVDSRKG